MLKVVITGDEREGKTVLAAFITKALKDIGYDVKSDEPQQLKNISDATMVRTQFVGQRPRTFSAREVGIFSIGEFPSSPCKGWHLSRKAPRRPDRG